MDYDADGNKLMMRVTKIDPSDQLSGGGDSFTKTYHYLDGMVVSDTDKSYYTDGERARLRHRGVSWANETEPPPQNGVRSASEVYFFLRKIYGIGITDASGGFRAEYTISDHLGNGRVWFADLNNDGKIDCDQTEVLQKENYYPFGMAQEGEWQNDPNNPDPLGVPAPSEANDRFKYNGLESEDDLTGWIFYKFRAYDPGLGRFISVDPAASMYPFQSPYAYIMNNPVRYADFMGLGLEADFYDQKGKYLGTDGVDDGRNFVVTNRKEARSIKKTNSKGGTTAVSDVQSGVELPSSFVRGEMGKAVDRAGSPSFHEEGGYFGTTSGGEEFVVHAAPGEKADPSKDPHASINVFKAADISTLPNDANPTREGTFHTHPDGTVTSSTGGINTIGGTTTTYSFGNAPSTTDINNARSNVAGITGNRYVLAQGNNTVYIYNGSGVIATFPLAKFRSIGNKK